MAVDAAAVRVDADAVRHTNLFMVQNGILRRGVYGDLWRSPPGCDDVRVAVFEFDVVNLVTPSQLLPYDGRDGCLWGLCGRVRPICTVGKI
jgi:hypothetical protein